MSGLTGVERIAAVFARARAEGRAALMPYVPLGYPTLEISPAVVKAAVAGGADLLELGLPFSDPLADGPVIQAATQRALQEGMTTARGLEMVAGLRREGVEIPFVVMGYYNPIMAYGEAAFCAACRAAGADGMIVADLPVEEGAALEQACAEQGLALIYLVAPTSPAGRVKLVAERSQGFVYLVSVAGVTGARTELPPDLSAFVARVRQETDKPLAVGFGIATPMQAAQVAKLADGVIVGSALVRCAGEPDAPAQVEAFVRSLKGCP